MGDITNIFDKARAERKEKKTKEEKGTDKTEIVVVQAIDDRNVKVVYSSSNKAIQESTMNISSLMTIENIIIIIHT